MSTKVMKFGGTSLRSEATRRYMYRRVLENGRTNKVIVTVSATGHYPDAYTTDTLLSMGSEFFTRQEETRLVSMGEQLSALKIYGELLDMGIRAYALPSFDCGILTSRNYDYTKVLKLDYTGIRRKLDSCDVLVVGGFTGISPSGHVTTLDRGGSDYSAVSFVGILDLKEVDIYTDVDGVYDRDPRPNEYAVKYSKLTYDGVLNMRSRILHGRCVSYTRDHHIRIYLKGIFSISLGTIVGD